MPENDRNVPELSLPEAEEYASVGPERFMPYHFSVGYALDITPLMDSGIWALRLKEPDSGIKGERNVVPGRFFTTRVGLRLNEKGYTELGIRIDIRYSLFKLQLEKEKREISSLYRQIGQIDSDEDYRLYHERVCSLMSVLMTHLPKLLRNEQDFADAFREFIDNSF